MIWGYHYFWKHPYCQLDYISSADAFPSDVDQKIWNFACMFVYQKVYDTGMYLYSYVYIYTYFHALTAFCQTVSLENVLPECDPIDFHNATAARGKKSTHHGNVASDLQKHGTPQFHVRTSGLKFWDLTLLGCPRKLVNG